MEGAKSTPCVRSDPLLRMESDHSIASYKSCVSNGGFDHDRGTDSGGGFDQDRCTGNSGAGGGIVVKALIEKHKSFQDRLMNAKVADFDVKRKSLAKTCALLSASYANCLDAGARHHGDDRTERVECVDDFVSIADDTTMISFRLAARMPPRNADSLTETDLAPVCRRQHRDGLLRPLDVVDYVPWNRSKPNAGSKGGGAVGCI